MASPVRKGGAQ
jgi:hypothetical protein